MANYVKSTKGDRWIIVSEKRGARGDNADKKAHDCIFCEDNEHLTPQEIHRLGPGHKNTPGWDVRVISNKFPVTDIHEVIIHSTDHERDFAELPHSDSQNIIEVYKDRYNTHKQSGQVLIFNNHGTHAGASQTHPHSQLCVFPNTVQLNILEPQKVENAVLETKHFTIYCPEFSQWPYEVWVKPHVSKTLFGEITDSEIEDISLVIKRTTRALAKIYSTSKLFSKVNHNHHPFGYNFYIYPHLNWYIRFIPRFVHLGGIEVSSGLIVNIIEPSEAASDLRHIL